MSRWARVLSRSRPVPPFPRSHLPPRSPDWSPSSRFGGKGSEGSPERRGRRRQKASKGDRRQREQEEGESNRKEGVEKC